MPKRLQCIIPGCDATIDGLTEEQVLAQVETHITRDHPDLELDAQATDSIRANIEDVGDE
ncbi:DUF1059 domain-containing protein [Haloarchaeobius amylolyticus]|uniref:DUF1059 domain-containing protein n=1 Tax=Haloarchaeobius amylolyticus TaxID=1198296 RepID=UPI00226F17C6|nr:DUF1059 domain-containing protein [Haloarchaeobius amylolyticus]